MNYTRSITKSFKIQRRSIIDKTITVELEQDSYIYNGSEIRPAVTMKHNDYVMKEGKDYLVTYTNNTNAGTAEVTVEGIGNYSRSITRTFTIQRKSLISDKITAELEAESYTYNGTEICPIVTMKNGPWIMEESKHYKLTYSNNLNAGTAYVVVDGIGNYKDQIRLKYSIEKADQKLSVNIPSENVAIGEAVKIQVDGIGEIHYSSDDEDVLQVTTDGTMIGKGIGIAHLTVTASGDMNYRSDTVQIEIIVCSSDCDHEWDEGTVTKEPTVVSEGERTYTCRKCGDTKVEIIARRENPFSDVRGNAYYYNAVMWAVGNDITGGTSATTFSPNQSCTRAQVMTFLWKANGSPEPKSTRNPFTDIKSSNYYYKAVLWAVENGITEGATATTFAPNKECTREQVVSFMWKAAGEPEPAAGSNPFTDVSSKKYYYKPVMWAVENGIASGATSTTFGTGKICNRAQVMTFLYNAYH